MRKFLALLKYELNRMVVSPSSYFIASIFLMIIALVYVFMMREFTLYAQDTTFVHEFLRCFWLPVLLIVPMITMRTFSDDYKTEIMHATKTTPVSDTSIVLSKFFHAYIFYAILWISSLLFIAITFTFAPNMLRDPSFLITSSAIGGYYYILISGLMFVSMGLFFSSLTGNQILSGSLSFISIFTLFLNGQILQFRGKFTDTIVDHALIRPLNIFLQLDNACCGVFDTRIVVLYGSVTVLFLVFTKISLERKLS